MTADRARIASLAGFDRELGLDAVPRLRSAAAMPAEPHGDSVASSSVASSSVAERGARPGLVSSPAQPVTTAGHPSTAPRPVPRHCFPPESLVAPRSAQERAQRLEEIDRRHAETCPHCKTATGHTRLVFGEGAPGAELLFVGEAPGETEDREGRPFIGPAGEKLDEMIRAMGLRREEVYVANVLKSRPPNNRTPTPEEVDACGPFLAEQILAIRPRVIVTLGGPATQWVCGIQAGISRVRGTWQSWNPPAGADCEPIPVMPTYHPAYVLRTYTRQVRAEVWSDLRAALGRIGRQPPPRPGADPGAD
jgi:DNA polymerase